MEYNSDFQKALHVSPYTYCTSPKPNYFCDFVVNANLKDTLINLGAKFHKNENQDWSNQYQTTISNEKYPKASFYLKEKVPFFELSNNSFMFKINSVQPSLLFNFQPYPFKSYCLSAKFVKDPSVTSSFVYKNDYIMSAHLGEVTSHFDFCIKEGDFFSSFTGIEFKRSSNIIDSLSMIYSGLSMKLFDRLCSIAYIISMRGLKVACHFGGPDSRITYIKKLEPDTNYTEVNRHVFEYIWRENGSKTGMLVQTWSPLALYMRGSKKFGFLKLKWRLGGELDNSSQRFDYGIGVKMSLPSNPAKKIMPEEIKPIENVPTQKMNKIVNIIDQNNGTENIYNLEAYE